ncbi:hypothetical protein ASG29_08215 [Sphingomonas sp. Leaf412]|uniref:hypothetical protein n=1 Tax=Sphingomonas sp. Leaf412 TaxID=1736370 RepID=UPI0006F6C6A2|nr:hypothetical protein [Sphingomonas sp. Leaf412]KQT31867.1 hypothetical protein ASG29_08215 [Sphingomonas sp. Leaf412]
MYSESDIDTAVAAGVLSPAAATAFRNHVAASRATPAVDEEHFRLLTGFNDIFVSIAIMLLLLAVAQLGSSVADWGGGLLVAAVAWGLALYFTARRRMALPSILLLLAFVGGVGMMMGGVVTMLFPGMDDRGTAVAGAGVAALCAGAAWLHWRRFMVPVTVAAGAAALVALALALLLAAIPGATAALWPLMLVGGVAVFAYAMRWDLSDRERQTRRADVAFWLHLAAAPLIAHPTFQMLGVFGREIGLGTALVVLLLYGAFAIVALAVDRRALLVSGLAYVLYAMFALIRSAGSGTVELSWAVTGVAIGSALLTLSAFWQPMRRAVVARLGALGQRLPPVQLAV